VKQFPIGQVNPKVPLPLDMMICTYTGTELKREKAAHTELDSPRRSIAVVFIPTLSKHSYANLDNRAEAKSHSRNFSMQSLPFGGRKLSPYNSFYLADRVTELPILVLIRHMLGSLHCRHL
jgi:hypothetical protein